MNSHKQESRGGRSPHALKRQVAEGFAGVSKCLAAESVAAGRTHLAHELQPAARLVQARERRGAALARVHIGISCHREAGPGGLLGSVLGEQLS